jgi:mono/diheme cytochrome c family protein
MGPCSARPLQPCDTACACMQASIQMSAQANAAKVAAAGAALLVATPAFAGDAGAGEKIFNANCAACHAGGQNSVVPDHTLEKAAIEKVCPIPMLC